MKAQIDALEGKYFAAYEALDALVTPDENGDMQITWDEYDVR